MKYGEKIVKEFDPEKDLEIWPNENKKNFEITITLPEFTCLCPRSGYPDFGKVIIKYIPDAYVVELKAIKLYINSFRDRNISHESSANEIYDLLVEKINPKYLNVTVDFEPRGNVHTLVELDSEKMKREYTK